MKFPARRVKFHLKVWWILQFLILRFTNNRNFSCISDLQRVCTKRGYRMSLGLPAKSGQSNGWSSWIADGLVQLALHDPPLTKGVRPQEKQVFPLPFIRCIRLSIIGPIQTPCHRCPEAYHRRHPTPILQRGIQPGQRRWRSDFGENFWVFQISTILKGRLFEKFSLTFKHPKFWK